jgi:hypothetical protein
VLTWQVARIKAHAALVAEGIRELRALPADGGP